ncbi:uncharacterized protein TERG_12055 [Trichophyton rubrum CBS 118892]|uniref:Fungal lipase-type domain-containing protein n=1 Tax=Trichophyton rubrum (strain ATCC MYA-4607 / CBS 118892) TaxID=559305 RepID=A0A080WT50_TRIRC|nr:uncharacterized protein TERG_12055 [Trichophyton rubrum CBS 118892]KFL61338.1 hypothetical protein TERG_12055 [Trichophyton rubrum CBS 118892]
MLSRKHRPAPSVKSLPISPPLPFPPAYYHQHGHEHHHDHARDAKQAPDHAEIYPQMAPRDYPDYAAVPGPAPDVNLAVEQSYFDLRGQHHHHHHHHLHHHQERHEQYPFSPNDYSYEFNSYSAPRLPPSPPTSPPYVAAAPREDRDSYPASLASLPRSLKSAGHRRGTRSMGSATAVSQPSRLSRGGSATTDVGQASDVSIDLTDMLSDKLDEVINHMDMQVFSGRERDLYLDVDAGPAGPDAASKTSSGRSFLRSSTSASHKTNYFAKAYHYANSRLPPRLVPLNLYVSLFAFLFAMFVKAMVIKSVALDHMNLIVFAVRGTTRSSFTDWATNMNAEPATPTGFLDDPGNLCHAGFLSVARKMVRPVAMRLEQLLAENPARSKFSLVITGHSAGGAVASLLYAHILSSTLRSELIYLRDRFKRIHCFTFGSPPVSLLPINKPSDPRYAKWLFYTFVNEGDPVCRADKPYIRSLINLYKAPIPSTQGSRSRSSTTSSKPSKLAFLKDRRESTDKSDFETEVTWPIPSPTLTLPGCLIVLRGDKHNPRDKDVVEAYLTNNEQMAGVVFGDVMMHMMILYERRIQLLATDAVTARAAR